MSDSEEYDESGPSCSDAGGSILTLESGSCESVPSRVGNVGVRENVRRLIMKQ